MNYISQIIYPLLTVFWWVPLLLLIPIARTAWFKGLMGEWMVNLSARLFLPSSKYTRFHNVTLNTLDGTTQIDHVFVSVYGVFCVETKNMTGWIFGRERDKQWTQKIFKESFRFQNPLRQNYKHTKALEAALDIPHSVIHSVVVFAGDATFKTDMPANVTYISGFTRYIKSFKTRVFSQSEVSRICEMISTGRLEPSWKTHRAHVRNLKKRTDLNAN